MCIIIHMKFAIFIIIGLSAAVFSEQKNIRDYLVLQGMKHSRPDPASPLKASSVFIANEQLHQKLDGFSYQTYIPTVNNFNHTICTFINSPYDGFYTGFMTEPGDIAATTKQANRCSLAVFGTTLFKPATSGELLRPDPKGVWEVFKKLYITPDQTIQGIAAEKLYRASLQQEVHSYADTIVLINKYRDIYNNSGNIYEFSHKVIQQHPDARDDFKNFSSYAFGSINRRKLDGSIDVFLKIMEMILQDYEPGYYIKNRQYLKGI